MDKTAIKNFAIWARQKLIEDISYKAGLLGISDKGIAEELPQSTGDLKFFDIGTKDYTEVSGKEIKQREALVDAIKSKERDVKNYSEAFEFIVEEVAYTWFNRLIAIRFMEVNGYLPSGIRVLSSGNRLKNEPDFVTNPFEADLDLTPTEEDLVLELKDQNKSDELFRMLFIKQCNKLHEVLPHLFEKTDDYTELLLTISFIDKDGVVYKLVNDIDEDDFNVEKEGQVEIIGWMYQYYNTEPKEKVIMALKKNIKISKDTIPAATQIFTPDWIVRYMVENSIGRLWLDGHPDDKVKENWLYYLNDENQNEDVNVAINRIKNEYKIINPEEIKVFDPCMGSGHILVYAFDVLIQIYESCGYTQRDAARNIVEKNIYGIDVDDRAYQLAYFAIMMKARQYNRRILSEKINPNLYSIQNSKILSNDSLKHLHSTRAIAETLIYEYANAKQYGSYLKISLTTKELDLLKEELSTLDNENSLNLIEIIEITNLKSSLYELINQAYIMVDKYDVVITNPPYAGRRNLNSFICEYIDENYPDSKMDLFSVFIEKNLEYTKKYGYSSYMTPFVWLYLSSFTSLRKLILSKGTVYSYLQPEEYSFKEAAVSICSFVIRKCSLNYNGSYIKLSKVKEAELQEHTYLECVKDTKCEHRYCFEMNKFNQMPDSRFVFWMSDKLIEIFGTSKSFEKVAKPRQGMATSDNDRFIRMWYEVCHSHIYKTANSCEEAYESNCKWFPYNKGGGFRKWFGNNYYVLNYENDGYEVKEYAAKLYKSYSRTIKNIQFYFKKSITWSDICGSSFAARACNNGFIFDVKGSSAFVDEEYYYYILAMLNSTISVELLNMLNPSITTQVGDLKQMPFIFNGEKAKEIIQLAQECVSLSKWDWDNYELSWDFRAHPLCKEGYLHYIYKEWEQVCEKNFNILKENEEKINRLFIEIYGLENEMIASVHEEDIAVRKADKKRDIVHLVTYAVGCMFGRYSLDKDGIVNTGDYINSSEYTTFIPDIDNCIPITDEEYFEDDIMGRFEEFIKSVYGADTLEENLNFIAEAIGKKGNISREIIRNYFLNDFIKDHNRIYQKRPIYWMYDSGKQNGFKALVYMHRWNADTTGNMRVEYLHRMQKVYENEIERMQEIIDNSTNSREVSNATKRKEKLQKQFKETKDYDVKIAHLALSRIDIDLDDGVKVNYEKVQTPDDGKVLKVLAKI